MRSIARVRAAPVLVLKRKGLELKIPTSFRDNGFGDFCRNKSHSLQLRSSERNIFYKNRERNLCQMNTLMTYQND